MEIKKKNYLGEKRKTSSIQTLYNFRLTGVPPDEAFRSIDVESQKYIEEIKQLVQKNYELNPILGILFIWKGKVISDWKRLVELGFNPR